MVAIVGHDGTMILSGDRQKDREIIARKLLMIFNIKQQNYCILITKSTVPLHYST